MRLWKPKQICLWNIIQYSTEGENVHTGLCWLNPLSLQTAFVGVNLNQTENSHAIHKMPNTTSTSTNISTNVVYFFPCALHPSAYLVYLFLLLSLAFRFMWGYLVCWTYTYYVLRKFITITPQFQKVSIEAHPHKNTKKRVSERWSLRIQRK